MEHLGNVIQNGNFTSLDNLCTAVEDVRTLEEKGGLDSWVAAIKTLFTIINKDEEEVSLISYQPIKEDWSGPTVFY